MRPALLILALVACKKGNDGIDPSEPCGTSAPEIDDVRVEGCEDHLFESGETFPAVLVKADTTDSDGDLTQFSVQVFWDEEIDGEVSTEGPFYQLDSFFDGEPYCGVDEATLGIWFAVTGEDDTPPYEAAVELGIVVLDEQNNASDGVVVVEATMPTEAGECP